VPDDPRALDALLEDRGGGWWSAFFADRAKESASPCPFLVGWPDESLVAWFSQGLLAPGACSNWAAEMAGTRSTWPAWDAPSMPSTSPNGPSS